MVIGDQFDCRLVVIHCHTLIRTTTTPSQYKTHFLSVMNYHNMDDEEDQRSNDWVLGCGIVVFGLVLIVTAGVISVVIYGMNYV